MVLQRERGLFSLRAPSYIFFFSSGAFWVMRTAPSLHHFSPPPTQYRLFFAVRSPERAFCLEKSPATEKQRRRQSKNGAKEWGRKEKKRNPSYWMPLRYGWMDGIEQMEQLHSWREDINGFSVPAQLVRSSRKEGCDGWKGNFQEALWEGSFLCLISSIQWSSTFFLADVRPWDIKWDRAFFHCG